MTRTLLLLSLPFLCFCAAPSAVNEPLLDADAGVDEAVADDSDKTVVYECTANAGTKVYEIDYLLFQSVINIQSGNITRRSSSQTNGNNAAVQAALDESRALATEYCSAHNFRRGSTVLMSRRCIRR